MSIIFTAKFSAGRVRINYIHVKQWNVNTLLCPNSNGGWLNYLHIKYVKCWISQSWLVKEPPCVKISIYDLLGIGKAVMALNIVANEPNPTCNTTQKWINISG